MVVDEAGREPDGRDADANLVRLGAVAPPLPPLTGVCCVHAHLEDSGRLWYRVVSTPDVAAVDADLRRVHLEMEDAVREVRAFLLAFGRRGAG